MAKQNTAGLLARALVSNGKHNDYDGQLISKLDDMFAQHESGTVHVTEKVFYTVKDVIKKARKNYLGVYEEPTDPVTGNDKYWPPLTETFTDGVIKSIDFDTKDIDLYSKNGAKISATRVLKQVLRDKLKQAGFDKALNDLKRYIAIDGSGALKFIDDYDPVQKKRVMRIKAVDNLNIICDQTAESVVESFGLIERVLMTQDELRAQSPVWDNIDTVIANGNDSSSFDRLSNRISGISMVHSVGPVYPIYEYWGQVKKSWITEKPEDEGIWTEGHVVISNLGDSGDKTILLKELNKSGKRPYEEVALKKVLGRRTGRGVPEMLFGTQEYMCMLVEIRKKNAQILQNGLFVAKKGLGLTADTILSKLVAGGVVPVEERGDFEQLPIQDSRAASYQDEDRLISWGERNTGQYDVRRGESLAASAPATTQLIQDRNSRDLYQAVQEDIGLMLERFIEAHVLPWILKNVKDDEVVTITGSLSELEEFDNAMAEELVNKAFINHVEKHRRYPKPEELVEAKRKQREALSRMGRGRYLKLKKELFTDVNAGVTVAITNEEIDKTTIVTKLQELLVLTANNPNLSLDMQGLIDTMMDMMGLPADRFYSSPMDQPSPIDRMAKKQEAEKQAQELQNMKQQMAEPSQQMNAITGKSAPQQKFGPDTPAGMSMDPTMRTPENQTLIPS